MRLFKMRDQEFVEVRIRTDDRPILNSCRECHCIGTRAEFNVDAKERSKFSTTIFSAMNKCHAGRHQTKARKLPAHTEQCGHQKFDLMPIQVSADPDIVEQYAYIGTINILQSYVSVLNLL